MLATEGAKAPRLALQAAGLVAWEIDAATAEILADEGLGKLFGIAPGEADGTMAPFAARIHPEDRDATLAALAEATRPGGRYRAEFRVVRADGELRWLLGAAEGVAGPDGRVRVVGLNADITDRRAVEAALQEAKTRLDLALDGAGVGTWLWRAPDGLVEADRVLARLWGFSPTDSGVRLPLAAFTDRIHPEDRPGVLAAIGAAVERGGAYAVDYRVHPADGGPDRWLSAHGQVGSRPDGEVVLDGAVIDVTGRKQLEAELREALATKEALLEEVNHRVKNSLQLVSGLLTLQASRSTDPELRTGLAEARTRIGVVARVHRRLYQAGTHGRIDDLGGFLRELCTDAVAALDRGAGRIQIEAELPTQAVPAPIDRAVPLALIVSELVTNAVKYAYPAEAGGVVRLRVDKGADGALLVEVADAGLGLPEGFDPASSPGVGMRVVMVLARQLRARLEVGRASPTGGAAFVLRLASDPALAGAGAEAD